MKERRKRNMSRTGLLFLFCLLMLCGCTQITEFMENTEVSGREVESLAAEKEEDTVLLGGMPVGIYMETDGVLVLDTEKMTGMDGKEYTPAQGVVSSGDYITEVNHQKIEGKTVDGSGGTSGWREGPSDSQTRKYDIRKEIDSCADFKRKLSPGNLGKR